MPEINWTIKGWGATGGGGGVGVQRWEGVYGCTGSLRPELCAGVGIEVRELMWFGRGWCAEVGGGGGVGGGGEVRGGFDVGEGGVNSKNHPSHRTYKSPKQFLWIAYLQTNELKRYKST